MDAAGIGRDHIVAVARASYDGKDSVGMNAQRRGASGRLGATRHTATEPRPHAGRLTLHVVTSIAALGRLILGKAGFPVVARNSE